IRARRKICTMGREVVPTMIDCLGSKDHHLRWEATKCLAHLPDPAAAPALVKELVDPASDVRWVSGQALIALGDDALVPVLRSLVERRTTNTYELYQGACHVLRELAARGHAELLTPVIEACRQLQPQIAVAIEAEKALQKLRSI
ncbi:MAG: HEAT repeat domain-containing protein, partial [Planctomycetes bacterium]|nr:HEAT repeat domain-containing protein [Planctomycetota bacterium]